MCLAVPGRITELGEREGLPMGRVDFNGLRREVCLAYVPEAKVGDWVVVHVGFAISTLDEAEAQRTLALLDELGELNELLDGDREGEGDGDGDGEREGGVDGDDKRAGGVGGERQGEAGGVAR